MKSMKTLILAMSLIGLLTAYAHAADPSATRVPEMSYRHRTLSNGLQVFDVQAHSTPIVAIQVWYKVGSKDDPKERSGFAHLFEHLMFKSTKHMKAESMDRLTEDVGGWNNASTWDDFTDYVEEVPSNYLETLLWAEADRMASLNVNEKNFISERDVVKEEFRQRILAPPYGMLFYLIDKLSFTTPGYGRPGIGSIDDLNAATLQDVRQFYRDFYRPDNAVLVVVGDFEREQLDGWVDKYFGPIPKPDLPLPVLDAKEPQRTGEKRHTEYRPNVPLPAIAITYLVPPIASPDAPALRIAETILSTGDSSRLYQSLVYRQQVARSIWANADFRKEAGLFVTGAITAGGKKPEEVEEALLAEIEQLRQKPVSEDELAKAKNQLITDELHGRETDNGKAFALAYAAVMLNDPDYVNQAIDQLQAVTTADVQRVFEEYFDQKNRVVIYYMDESLRPQSGGDSKEGK